MEGGAVRQRNFRVWRLTLLCLSALFGNLHATVNPTDLSVLNQLGSAWGVNTLGWGSGDACTWQGVVCDSTGTTVVDLLLQAGSISGTIPAAIGSFTGLQQLDLSFNTGLQGSIPVEIGKLTSLTSLIIQECSLTGTVPSTIGNLKNLTFLALNNNHLTGQIPSSLGSLPLLYWFDLSTNNLTGGLPVSTTSTDGYGLDTLANCMHFHFNNNSLSGGFPNEFGAPQSGPSKLTKLVHLLLENNQFSGPIPASVANLTSLQILSLSNNKFNGSIPTSINSMSSGTGSSLQQILVGINQLQGVIPNFTAISGTLTVVDFSSNAFDPQPFPSWIQNAPNLQTVYLEGSNLIGEFPSTILSAPQLETLWARQNSFNGTLQIPAVLGPELMTVSLQDNQFINIALTNVSTNLTQVDLQIAGNPVCATTNSARPTALCNTAVQSKQPWSSPYSTITNCPSTVCSGTSSINPFLTGNCNCSQPLELQLEARRPAFSVITDPLMETVREQLSSQLNLQLFQVWITAAAFTADGKCEINVDFFSTDGVSTLDSGTISNITHSLTGQAVSLPNLTPYLTRLLVDGDTFLAASKKKSLSGGAIAGIVVGVLAALAVVGIYAFWQKRRAQKLKHRAQPFAKWGGAQGEKDVSAPIIAGTRFFTFNEVKKVTNNFADEIGVGGYGKVYSGVLDSGVKVAVKRAQEGSMQGAEEFKNEIELLSRVHHKNLLGLVGYCYEHGEQMLVYEFMVNGTVSEWLAGKMAYPLDWTKRLSIAVGSARGLTYLHELADPPIIHRDIKSQNILLDEKHIAKVADFGLSKLAPDGADKQIATDQVKGTLGYLDPEYYMTQHLSEKSDVYSFGVVLLELATSRPPIQGGKYIVREVRTALNEGGMDALEPLLDPSVYEASQEDLDRYIDLSLSCVADKGADRPTMNEVVKELETLAQHNRPKAKASAQATDPTWLTDVYGDEDYVSADHGSSSNHGPSSNFKYSGGYSPHGPQAK